MTMFQNLNLMMGEAQTLKIRCETCDRRAELSRSEAVAKFGADAAPYDIRRRSTCAGCGARNSAVVWI
jgi:hypothetical protein